MNNSASNNQTNKKPETDSKPLQNSTIGTLLTTLWFLQFIRSTLRVLKSSRNDLGVHKPESKCLWRFLTRTGLLLAHSMSKALNMCSAFVLSLASSTRNEWQFSCFPNHSQSELTSRHLSASLSISSIWVACASKIFLYSSYVDFKA